MGVRGVSDVANGGQPKPACKRGGAGMPCGLCNRGDGPELEPGFRVTNDAKHGRGTRRAVIPSNTETTHLEPLGVVFGTAAVAIADSRYGALRLDKSQLVLQQTSCGNARNDGSMLDDSSI